MPGHPVASGCGEPHGISRPDLASAFASIGIDQDYSRTDVTDLDVDVRGWGSDEPIFEQVLTSEGVANVAVRTTQLDITHVIVRLVSHSA